MGERMREATLRLQRQFVKVGRMDHMQKLTGTGLESCWVERCCGVGPPGPVCVRGAQQDRKPREARQQERSELACQADP
jgi:hypothetical protein